MTASILLAFWGRSSSLFGRAIIMFWLRPCMAHKSRMSVQIEDQKLHSNQPVFGGKLFWGYATLWQQARILSSIAAKVAALSNIVRISLCVHLEWVHMGVSKNYGFSPQIIHFNRLFHYIHHPFWGTPIFGNNHIPVHIWGENMDSLGFEEEFCRIF